MQCQGIRRRLVQVSRELFVGSIAGRLSRKSELRRYLAVLVARRDHGDLCSCIQEANNIMRQIRACDDLDPGLISYGSIEVNDEAIMVEDRAMMHPKQVAWGPCALPDDLQVFYSTSTTPQIDGEHVGSLQPQAVLSREPATLYVWGLPPDNAKELGRYTGGDVECRLYQLPVIEEVHLLAKISDCKLFAPYASGRSGAIDNQLALLALD